MEERSKMLNDIFSTCIQRKDETVLNAYLPKRLEYALYIQLNESQIDSYKVPHIAMRIDCSN